MVSAFSFLLLSLMDDLVIFSLPFVSALIGWFTNKIAIKMLFHPRKPINLLGFKWQGLIPKRQQDLAARTGEIIEKEILQKHILVGKLKEMDLEPHFHSFIDDLVTDSLVPRIKAIPFLGGFVTDDLVEKLVVMAKESVDEKSGPFIESISKDVEGEIHIQQLVEDRINELDLDALENIVHQIASKEFRSIEILGGVLGFIIGLAQLAMLWATGHVSF